VLLAFLRCLFVAGRPGLAGGEFLPLKRGAASVCYPDNSSLVPLPAKTGKNTYPALVKHDIVADKLEMHYFC
jgi:hypothetical protein